MFIYAFAKGARKGYLPKEFKTIAKESFDKFTKSATITNADGTTSITKACGVAGLGGTPYRSGTYEYYIGEKQRNDDPKVVGPFILAALELSKL
jgi:unsaturated rhamnogalacturonyl hydrolase